MARIDDALNNSEVALKLVAEQAISVNAFGLIAVALFQTLLTEKIITLEQAARIIDLAESGLDDPRTADVLQETKDEVRKMYAKYRLSIGLFAVEEGGHG